MNEKIGEAKTGEGRGNMENDKGKGKKKLHGKINAKEIIRKKVNIKSKKGE